MNNDRIIQASIEERKQQIYTLFPTKLKCSNCDGVLIGCIEFKCDYGVCKCGRVFGSTVHSGKHSYTNDD